MTLDFIKQFYVQVDNDEDKYAALTDLLAAGPKAPLVIFCDVGRNANQLAERLEHVEDESVCLCPSH